MRRKDIRRLLTTAELRDIRAREEREGSPYSDRDMLLDHIDILTSAVVDQAIADYIDVRGNDAFGT